MSLRAERSNLKALRWRSLPEGLMLHFVRNDMATFIYVRLLNGAIAVNSALGVNTELAIAHN